MIYVFRSDHSDIQYTPFKWEEDGSVYCIGVIRLPLQTKEKVRSKVTTTLYNSGDDMDTFNIEFDFEIQAHISYVGNHNKDITITIKNFWNLYVVFKLLHCTV